MPSEKDKLKRLGFYTDFNGVVLDFFPSGRLCSYIGHDFLLVMKHMHIDRESYSQISDVILDKYVNSEKLDVRSFFNYRLTVDRAVKKSKLLKQEIEFFLEFIENIFIDLLNYYVNLINVDNQSLTMEDLLFAINDDNDRKFIECLNLPKNYFHLSLDVLLRKIKSDGFFTLKKFDLSSFISEISSFRFNSERFDYDFEIQYRLDSLQDAIKTFYHQNLTRFLKENQITSLLNLSEYYSIEPEDFLDYVTIDINGLMRDLADKYGIIIKSEGDDITSSEIIVYKIM